MTRLLLRIHPQGCPGIIHEQGWGGSWRFKWEETVKWEETGAPEWVLQGDLLLCDSNYKGIKRCIGKVVLF